MYNNLLIFIFLTAIFPTLKYNYSNKLSYIIPIFRISFFILVWSSDTGLIIQKEKQQQTIIEIIVVENSIFSSLDTASCR